MAHNIRFHNFSTDYGKKWIFLIHSDWSDNSFFYFEAFFASGGPFGAFFGALFTGFNLPKVPKWSWVPNNTIPDDHMPKKVNSYNECPLLAMWVP